MCLIPTTIGGLLSAIGIAGMDRMIQHNVIATSGKAVEAAGDVSTMLLDKTGTITLGNREAVAFIPGPVIGCVETSPNKPSSRHCPTRHPKGARSWRSPSGSSACESGTFSSNTRPSFRSRPRRA